MSKMFGTKNRIVKLLSKKAMNITEISETLGLSKATVSQHISELEGMSVVEQLDNSHFKKVKYYKLSGKGNTVMERGNDSRATLDKLIIPAVLAVLFVAILLHFSANTHNIGSSIPPINTNNTPNTSTHGIGVACPMITAFTNGNHANESVLSGIISEIALGNPCSIAYVNNGTIAGLNYTAHNGTVDVQELGYAYTINSTDIRNLEANLDKGYCSDQKALEFFGISYPKPSGVSCKANIYG